MTNQETPTPSRPRRKVGSRDGLFQRNGWWWIDYYDAEGKRHRRKAAPDYQTAKLLYRETMTAIARSEVLGVRDEGLRFKDFVERRYWPKVQPTLAPEWAARSWDMLEHGLLPRFGATRLAGIRQEDVEAWYAERLAQVKASTANRELARLKHALGRAVAWRYLKANPAQPVKKAKELPGRVRYLAPDEREILLNGRDMTVTATDSRTWAVRRAPHPVLRVYIVAALQTGARRSELVRLTWAGVDLRARTVTFRHTKNGEARTVPMTATLREALASLPRPLDPAAPVFPERDPKVLSRMFARYVRAVGLVNLTFHDLRHDAASTLTMAGVPQRSIMEILGHRDPRMTLRYQHLAPGHLRDAMRALDAAPTTAAREAPAEAR